MILAAAVLALLMLFTALMIYVPPLNHAVARWCGAPDGMSFSAFLWMTEQMEEQPKHWLGLLLRAPVDGIFRMFGGQTDHCRHTYENDIAGAQP